MVFFILIMTKDSPPYESVAVIVGKKKKPSADFLSLGRHCHHFSTFFSNHCLYNTVTAIPFPLFTLCGVSRPLKVLFVCLLNSNGFLLFTNHTAKCPNVVSFPSHFLAHFFLLSSCVILKPLLSKQASEFLFFALHFHRLSLLFTMGYQQTKNVNTFVSENI